MIFYPEERIALFIDGANLYSAARGLAFDIDNSFVNLTHDPSNTVANDLNGYKHVGRVLTYEKLLDETGREMHRSWGNSIEANEDVTCQSVDLFVQVGDFEFGL